MQPAENEDICIEKGFHSKNNKNETFFYLNSKVWTTRLGCWKTKLIKNILEFKTIHSYVDYIFYFRQPTSTKISFVIFTKSKCIKKI